MLLKAAKFVSERRFSDFVHLRESLETETQRSVPYSLPSKMASLIKTSGRLTEERKAGLADFTQKLLNDPQYRQNPLVLSFFNIPRDSALEFDCDDAEKIKDARTSQQVVRIDTPVHWLETLKDVKHMLRTAKLAIDNNGNSVGNRGKINLCRVKLTSLDQYLRENQDLGAGELVRRRHMLAEAEREFNQLETYDSPHYQVKSTRNTSSDGIKSKLFSGSTSFGRTLGRAKETEVTRTMDNNQLYQSQQTVMETQDQQLEEMHKMIQRQKQLGMAINEELDTQSEMLTDLGQHIDKSAGKMKHARRKIGRIL